ncbi:MAG: multi-sensor signal transduction histidine kinase [Polaromonas sp.]|nr:multi-sensor signal transduction histidine kinase [Polaromonas sp.]
MLSHLGLRSRLALLVLIALLPVFGLFLYSAAANRQAVETFAQASLRSEALLAAAHQQRLVERIAQLLADMASTPSVQDSTNRLCVQYFKNLQAQNAGYSNLGVVALNGRLSCDAADTGEAVDISDRVFFRKVLDEKKFSIGEYTASGLGGRPGIAFGMPVYSSQQVLTGVAFASLDLDEVARALGQDEILDGAKLRVMDRRGRVLAAYPKTPGPPGRQEPDALVVEAARMAAPGMREAVDAQGIEQVYAYAPVDAPGTAGGLFVAISVPRAVITAAPRALMLGNLAALLAMTTLGMACAWALGKRLVVNPANEILQEADQIAHGNFEPRVKASPGSQHEIGRLGAAFNHMAESLQLQRTKLDAALRQADEERAMLDLILNSMSEGVVAIDCSDRFMLFNAAARKIFPPPAVGESFTHWRRDNPLQVVSTKAVDLNGPLTQTLAGATFANQDMLFSRPNAQDRILKMSARPLLGPDRQQIGALTVFTDVTELRAAESFALAQEKVLVLIAGGAPARQSLEAVLRLIESSEPQSLCSILMVEDGQLRHGIAPSLPADFVQAIDGLAVAEGSGACGTAAFRKKTVIVEDVEQDPLAHAHLPLLQAHGLRACWSTPVVAGDGEVLATFAIYRRAPGRPQARDLTLIATATRLAGLVLERVRAEAALVSSEARFRELAENIEDVFYNVDVRTHQMHYISPSYEKVWGRTCESLYAHPYSYLEAVLPADRHILKLVNEQHLLGKPTSLEYRIVLPDGRIRWVNGRSYPIVNAKGELERVVGTGRDITERKLAALELAATYRALQMLSRSSIAINRINEEAGLLAEVCRVAVEVGGYRMAWVGYAQDDEAKTITPAAHAGEELGYLSAISLSWRDDVPGGQGPAGQAIRTGKPQQSTDIGQSDNRFYWSREAMERGYHSTLILPLCNEQHSFGVLALYAGDIQQFAPEEVKLLQELADNLAFGILSLRARLAHHRSEEAARQAAARLNEQASLINLSRDAIMVRNLDRTLRFWNKGAERLYGWTAEEVMGKTMEAQMYRSPQVLIAVMEQTLADGGEWNGELEQVTRDGTSVHVETRTTAVRDAQGRVTGMLGINTDIRERKHAREEILRLNTSLEERVEQRTAQLKFANQQLEAFSYSVSHDLRSPLSAINGFSTLLEKALSKPGEPPLTDRNRHYLARIRAGVGQMGELIDAMLSLAQVSRSVLCWEQVDLSAQAEALLASLQEHAPGRAAQLQVEPGLVVQGDPRLLRQVLDNLLANAWKFTAGKACARITLGRQQGSAGESVFFVRDNGAGFDMAYAPKLFGAFQRLHTQAEFAGTGIGLATVQRIIVRHGGRVWAESVKDEGATFYFTLGAATPLNSP